MDLFKKNVCLGELVKCWDGKIGERISQSWDIILWSLLCNQNLWLLKAKIVSIRGGRAASTSIKASCDSCDSFYSFTLLSWMSLWFKGILWLATSFQCHFGASSWFWSIFYGFPSPKLVSQTWGASPKRWRTPWLGFIIKNRVFSLFNFFFGGGGVTLGVVYFLKLLRRWLEDVQQFFVPIYRS